MVRKRFLVTCVFILLLLFLSQTFLILLKTGKENNVITDQKNQTITQLKSSGFWELSPFIIDDTGFGDYTWEEAALEPWCNGSGTWNYPYIIENITINAGGVGTGLQISYSNKYFIIRNSTFTNSGVGSNAGIRLWGVANGTFENNTLSAYNGISITSNSYNNTIFRNIGINNTIGINLGGTRGNRVINNTLINSEHISIYVHSASFNNSIIGNTIIDNNVSIWDDPAAIVVSLSDNNSIINNTIINSLATGIRLTYSDYNLIKNNTCVFSEYGIYFDDSNYNNLTANRLYNNTKDGIYIYDSEHNIFSKNILLNNSRYGINIDSNYLISDYSIHNILYNNTFIGNSENARDWGGSSSVRYNQWNFTNLGNFWDDYSGIDENDDGIGDSPYEILSNYQESKDYWPKWLDGPKIILKEPSNNDVYKNPPFFIIESTDPNLDIMWYTVNYSNNKFFIYDNGTIDFDAWSSLTEGNLSIKFYANDTFGNINFEEVMVFKDLSAPIINITNPINYTIIGDIAPNFSVNVIDLALNSTWYDLNGGGLKFLFSGINGTINQSAWNLLSEGLISINFYANDSFGHLSHEELLIIKDITQPEITIITPQQETKVNRTAPRFIIEITELHLEEIWYSLDDGQNNISIMSNGTINQNLWETVWDSLLHNDEISIEFYAIDIVGNVGTVEVILIKYAPSSPLAISGYNLFFVISFIFLIIPILKIKKFNRRL